MSLYRCVSSTSTQKSCRSRLTGGRDRSRLHGHQSSAQEHQSSLQRHQSRAQGHRCSTAGGYGAHCRCIGRDCSSFSRRYRLISRPGRRLQWPLQAHPLTIAGACNHDCCFQSAQVPGAPMEIQFLRRTIAGTCSEHCKGMQWSLQGRTTGIAEASVPREGSSVGVEASSVLGAGAYTEHCRCIGDGRKIITRRGSRIEAPSRDIRSSLQTLPHAHAVALRCSRSTTGPNSVRLHPVQVRLRPCRIDECTPR
jgi:hypothetical protein